MENTKMVNQVDQETKRKYRIGDKVDIRAKSQVVGRFRESGYYVFRVAYSFRDPIRVATEFGIRCFREDELFLLLPSCAVGLSDC